MRIEEDHFRITSHASSGTTGDSIFPTISNCPAMKPKRLRFFELTGTIFATGVPRFVMRTGSPVALTSSITDRQRALNSPAGIFFMVSS
jgi:hypothetical protein